MVLGQENAFPALFGRERGSSPLTPGFLGSSHRLWVQTWSTLLFVPEWEEDAGPERRQHARVQQLGNNFPVSEDFSSVYLKHLLSIYVLVSQLRPRLNPSKLWCKDVSLTG